jgi:hypothetical protein
LSCLVETFKTFTLSILYCSINNCIRHTFHNLETLSLIYTFKTVASSFQF